MTIRTLRSAALLALLPALTLEGCTTDGDFLDASAPGPSSPHSGDPASVVTTPGDTASTQREAAYVAGQFLVRTASLGVLQDVVSSAGATILREPGLSGYALVDVGEHSASQTLAKLQADERVERIYPNGRTGGAANGSGRHRSVQWHLTQMGEPSLHSEDFSDVTVAVLDTGANTESVFSYGVYYKQVGALRLVPVADGYDFINNDDAPYDDHQHGSHIATTLMGDGAVMGSAPGATLMPVKVLDAMNSGTEWELVEGIYWAMTHGADVINMSLSFSPDYVPSGALMQALTLASDSGAVLVAAAGNQVADQATFPAAHPDVIAVGSHTPDSATSVRPAWYGNLGTAVDVMAPGGDTTADRDGNGLNDGVLAHTIRPFQPWSTQYFFMAGTSQAAALTSGVAVQLLHDGVAPEEVQRRLQVGATSVPGSFLNGEGAGNLDAPAALSATEVSGPSSAHLGLLPYLAADGINVVPTADIAVVDDVGAPLANAQVLVTALGDTSETWLSCTTDANGQCQVQTPAVSDGLPRTVVFRADAVVIDDTWSVHPLPMVHESPVMQDLVAAMQADPALQDLPLAVAWDAGMDSELGDVAESYSVVNTGSGLASLPIGMVFNRAKMQTFSTTTHTVSLQGTPVTVKAIEMGGAGLASLPIGMNFAPLGFVSGSGLASLPIGLHPRGVFVRNEVATPVWMDAPDGPFGATPGTPLHAKLLEGGWMAHGYPAASFAAAATGVSVTASVAVGSNRDVLSMNDPYEPLD